MFGCERRVVCAKVVKKLAFTVMASVRVKVNCSGSGVSADRTIAADSADAYGTKVCRYN